MKNRISNLVMVSIGCVALLPAVQAGPTPPTPPTQNVNVVNTPNVNVANTPSVNVASMPAPSRLRVSFLASWTNNTGHRFVIEEIEFVDSFYDSVRWQLHPLGNGVPLYEEETALTQATPDSLFSAHLSRKLFLEPNEVFFTGLPPLDGPQVYLSGYLE